MTEKQWEAFCRFKEDLKLKVAEWSLMAPELMELQKQAAVQTKTPLYPFETAIVYNRDYDKITKEDDIHLIVIGDNPGKDEQLAKNNRYLVGQAGKIAEGFFKKNPNLGTDFRKNVIIVNKTPIHSAKTNHLKIMMKTGGQKIVDLVTESQLWMAERTAKLHQELGTAELWLVGYSELKEKGFFVPYRDKLLEVYKNEQRGQTPMNNWDKVYVFQHFSMNRFSIDLKEYQETKGTDPVVNLDVIHELGTKHKIEIFGE